MLPQPSYVFLSVARNTSGQGSVLATIREINIAVEAVRTILRRPRRWVISLGRSLEQIVLKSGLCSHIDSRVLADCLGRVLIG